MTINEVKLRRIKDVLKALSGLQDFGKKTKQQIHIDLKYCYYDLSFKFTTASASLTADVLGGYNHATALHGRRKFGELYGAPSFHYNSLYGEAFALIKKEFTETNFGNLLTDAQKIQKQRISFIMLTEKSHSIINRQAEEIKTLKAKVEKLKEELFCNSLI